jgi:dihydroneopterin aldolase
MPPGTTITLRGMRFHIRIGTLPHEAELPQPIEIDLSVWRPEAKGHEVLDYRRLYAAAEDVAAREPLAYLEDVAEALVDAALAFPGVHRVRAAVRKPHVPLPGPLVHAEVVVERGRP